MMYTSVSGISQLLDTTLWDAEKLNEEAITLSPQVVGWIDEQLGKSTNFTVEELAAEPIISLASNCFAVYLLLSTQLDGHHVEEVSLAIRRLDDAKDYIRAYCFRNGIVPVFDAVGVNISGTVSYGFGVGTDAGCI